MIAVRHAEPSDIPRLVESMRELGRISAIVVAPRVRRKGIGDRRKDAHAFYRAFGFAEKRSRFVKKLAG